MTRPFDRVLLMGDGHSGATTGLTPSDYECSDALKPHGPRRRELWKRFKAVIERLKPIDYVIDTGDAVQGFLGGSVARNVANSAILRVFDCDRAAHQIDLVPSQIQQLRSP